MPLIANYVDGKMIREDEKDILKSSWRLFILFWASVGSLFAFLHKAGFMDLPAAAKNVQAVRTMADSNSLRVKTIKRDIQRLHEIEAARIEREKYMSQQISDIKIQQKTQGDDLRLIIQLLRNNRDPFKR
jgi:hypothetical protein